MPSGYSYIGYLKIDETAGELVSQGVGNKALLPSAADGRTLEVSSTTGALQIMSSGTTLSNGVSRDGVSKFAGKWFRGTIAVDSNDPGGAFSLQNTYSSDLLVTRGVVMIVSTGGGEASLLNIGTDDEGDVSSDNIIDGLSLNAATGAFDNFDDKGSSGNTIQVWKASEYLIGTLESTADGCVAHYGIQVLDVTA